MLKTKLTTAHIYKTSLNVSYQGFNTAMYTFMIKWLPHNMIEFSERHSFHFALNSNITFLYCSGIVIILCFRVDLFCFYHTCKKGASLLVSGRGWNEGLVHKGLLLTCESCKATIKDSENKHEQDGSTLRTLLYTSCNCTSQLWYWWYYFSMKIKLLLHKLTVCTLQDYFPSLSRCRQLWKSNISHFIHILWIIWPQHHCLVSCSAVSASISPFSFILGSVVVAFAAFVDFLQGKQESTLFLNGFQIK